MIFLRPMSRQKSSPAVDEMTTASILEYFAAVPDPRIDRRRLHPLTSRLALSPVAVICGADSFVAIEEFGESKEAWLKTFLDFPNGIPSHDTLGRVFAILDPVALAEAFREWMRAVAGLTQGGVVALDGKTLRRSFRERGGGFIHLVSAWSAQNRVVLAQVKTEEKSSEITAIPRLLELLHDSRREYLATGPVAGSPHSGPDRVGAHCRWEDHAGAAPLHLLQVVSVREERHG